MLTTKLLNGQQPPAGVRPPTVNGIDAMAWWAGQIGSQRKMQVA